jgi:hypothetical protein
MAMDVQGKKLGFGWTNAKSRPSGIVSGEMINRETPTVAKELVLISAADNY